MYRQSLSPQAVSTISRATRNYATAVSSKFPGLQPSSPDVRTESVPGPQSLNVSKRIGTFQEDRAHVLVVDYDRSSGNYIIDADGNKVLDVFAQIASIAIGYNHPDLVSLAKSDEFVAAAINRPALGSFPSVAWSKVVEDGLLKVAPKGLDQVFTMQCGSSAVEGAMKAAFLQRQARKRSDPGKFSKEEVESVMNNAAPGSPDLSVISFKGGFHGRMLGSLSATRSKAIHKMDIPSFNWPACSFPELKYPLHEFEVENKATEAASLQDVEETIIAHKQSSPVAAIIVEPIQSEGGDRHASADYFRKLRALALKHDVFFIVDEVQTGIGATGTFWAHDKWHLDTPPDFVTFSKKAQASGFYHNKSTRAPLPYQAYNTWLGDPIRALQARDMFRVIERDGLVDNTARVGAALYEGLESVLSKASVQSKVNNLRGKGQGTFLAFDFMTQEDRNKFVSLMRSSGVNMGACGENSVRLRPMLIFEKHHADIFLQKMEDTLAAL